MSIVEEEDTAASGVMMSVEVFILVLSVVSTIPTDTVSYIVVVVLVEIRFDVVVGIVSVDDIVDVKGALALVLVMVVLVACSPSASTTSGLLVAVVD